MATDTAAGIRKRSFELPYRGGSIWCEHLDSMGTCEQEVLDKLTGDAEAFHRPSVSAFMIINLEETVLTDRIIGTMRCLFDGSGKRFLKIAMVGVERSRRNRLRAALSVTGASITFLEDYEKAKEWMLEQGNTE